MVLVISLGFNQLCVAAPLPITQSQTEAFAFTPSTILNGQSDTQNLVIPFKVFKTPKYVGSLNSLSVEARFAVSLRFQALQGSSFGDSWPIVYQFSFGSSPGYSAGSLGTPVRLPITYSCQAPVCSVGGQPFPTTNLISSFSLDKNELGLRSIVGKAGGELGLNALTAMGGGIPALLSSDVRGSATSTVVYTPRIPPQLKENAAQLGVALDGAASILKGVAVLVDPTRSVLKAAMFFADLATASAIDAIAASVDDQSETSSRAYSMLKIVLEGINGVAKVISNVGTPTNPAGLMLGLVSLALSGFSAIATTISKDPPDSNYKTLTITPAHDLGALDVLDPTDSLVSLGLALLNKILNAQELLINILGSLERFEGARIANDAEWQLNQLQHLSDSLAAYELLTSEIHDDLDGFAIEVGKRPVNNLDSHEIVPGKDILDLLDASSAFDAISFGQSLGLTPEASSALLMDIGARDISANGLGGTALSSLADEIYSTGDLTGQIRSETPVPEPGTFMMITLGAMMHWLARRRRSANKGTVTLGTC